MKRFWLIVLMGIGITIILLGFVYDVLFAGIPYQDPTPALQASYDFHSRIASIIRWSGTGIFMVGVLVGIIRRLMKKNQKQGNS